MKPHLATLALFVACSAETPQGQDRDSSDPNAEEPCGLNGPTGLAVGDCAPDFTLPDSTGEAFTLSAQRGKVALVDISALW